MMTRSTASHALLDLTKVPSVRIEQRHEMLEMFTGFEGANSYDVQDPDGNVIAHAAETTGGLQRVILGSSRLESIDLRNTNGDLIVSLRERWGFPFSTSHISGPNGEPQFQVKRRFAFFKRKIACWGEGSPDITITGPMFRPWTFWVDEGQTRVGKIAKRFSGLGTEMFTDADKFDIEFTAPVAHQEQRLRMLVLGFVVDMKFFEDSNRRNAGIAAGIFGASRR